MLLDPQTNRCLARDRTKTSFRDSCDMSCTAPEKPLGVTREELLGHDGIGRESLVFEHFARSDRDVGASAAQQRDMLSGKTG